MQKIVNKIVIFALVVIMVGLLIFSYASAISTYDLTVFIFANDADQQTNTELINQWAEQYAKEHADEIGKDSISVGISYQSDTNLYFSQVQRQIASGTADDIIYVSPKYVRSFALNDAVLDLTDYVDWSKYDPNGVWGSAMGAYAFVRGETLADSSIGDPVTYTANGSDGAGFYNEAGDKAGLYAVPKDFSSFGLGYNKLFFSEQLRQAYTTTIDRNGAIYYIDESGNETEPAALVNIGRTVRYYPFNYYKYETYDAALAAKDPIAAASDSVGGYDVTILGWPGDTYYTGEADDPATPYNDSIGYVAYTYAEYGAMAWAVGYYANSYDVPTPYAADGTRNSGAARGSHQLLTWLNGDNGAADNDYVYGNDQYEGSLYLTAWLLGNDVDIISDNYQSVTAPSADADYGIDSDKFKEAYAAFLAFGSDWNANSYFSGSPESVDTRGGYVTFLAGRTIFYGAGTWDLAGFNKEARNHLAVGLMPEPVSESYSPYARIKDANYESREYGDTPVTTAIAEGSDEWIDYQAPRQDAWAARQDTVGYGVNADVLEKFGEDSWQVDACADLCAFLALDPELQNALTYSGSQLTSFRDQGVSYLYYQGGATDDFYSDPDSVATYNFDNMITPDGNGENQLTVTVDEITRAGLTPQALGLPANASGTVTIGDGSTYTIENGVLPSKLRKESVVWTFATAVATKMFNDHDDVDGTVEEYINENFPSLSPYLNDYFAWNNMELVVDTAYAFKCINVVSLNYEDRNLQLRMMDGTNGALDSCMYTYNSQWIDEFGIVKGYTLIAWERDRLPGGYGQVYLGELTDDLIINPVSYNDGVWTARFFTPSAFCDWIVKRSQSFLDSAVTRERLIAGEI